MLVGEELVSLRMPRSEVFVERGEMAQRVKVLPVQPEVQSSVPRTRMYKTGHVVHASVFPGFLKEDGSRDKRLSGSWWAS